ncbi:MAG: DUF6198 family protein [Clostridiales bacterium]|nr:DUF6198 family protein [Clostridiales bacterium]
MSKKETAKRYILFIISLFFSAMGVAITKKGNLGVSPISSIPNVLSLKFTFFSLGNWLIVWNCILILGQILILRKNFKPIELLQFPLSFLFGYFTDFGGWLLHTLNADIYLVRIALVIIGTVVLGFGISLSVIANVVMNSGEAFVRALSDTLKKDFGTLKTILDISYVITAVILSLIFFNMHIEGAREGTVIAALFTGTVVKFFTYLLKNKINPLLQ